MFSLLDFSGRQPANGSCAVYPRIPLFFALTICIALLCMQVCGCAAYADDAASATASTDLTALEKRLFVETYPSQPIDERLARLEKFVFGSTRSGSDSERLTSLLLAVPSLGKSQSSSTGAGASSSSSNSQNAASGGANNSQSQANAGGGSSAVASGDGSPVSTDYYPTVTALEQKILGHTDERAKLSQRISDIETKAFGKPDLSGDDLATRVDKLKEYAAKRYGDDYLTTPEPAISARTGVPVDSLNITSQITLLEKTVFAKTYTKDGIISRLDRLEKSVFPEKPVDAFSSVRARVQRLMNSLEITNTAQAPSYSTPSYSSPYSGESPDRHATTAKHHFWHKVGSVLGAAGRMAAESAISSMSMGGMGPGYGGMGYPGSGMMFGGPGYGGMY